MRRKSLNWQLRGVNELLRVQRGKKSGVVGGKKKKHKPQTILSVRTQQIRYQKEF